MKTYCEDCGRAAGDGHIPSCIGNSLETFRAADELLAHRRSIPWEAHLDRFVERLHQRFIDHPTIIDEAKIIDECLRAYVAECRAIEDREDRCL